MSILDFFSRQAGQDRSRGLNRAISRFIPPNLRPTANFVGEMSPTSQLGVSGQGLVGALDSNASVSDRVGSVGQFLSGAAGVAAPMLVAPKAGMAASEAIQEGLLGASVAGRSSDPKTIGEAAAKTYKVGQLLRSPDGYKGAAGKPDAVSIPNEGKFAAMPIGPIEDAALSYMKKRGMDTSKFTEYPPFSEERAKFIAAAYDMMSHSPQNKDVKRAYDAMIQETMDQYNSLKNSGIDFTFMKEGMDDPYAASPALGYQDLVEKGNLYVFPTDFGFGTSAAFDPKTNPLLTKVGKVGDKEDAVANDAFRAVHDVFGHFGSGNPFFRHKGEERAFLEHSRMYSPEAQGAMTSETRGQNSWLNFGPYGAANRTASTPDTIFADQKSGLMPEFTFKPEGMPDPDMAKDLLEYMKRFNN